MDYAELVCSTWSKLGIISKSMLVGRNSSDTLGHLIVSDFLSLIVDRQRKFQKFQIPEGTTV